MTKKNIIFLSISLVLIILLGIGVSYSMWNISVSQDTNNTAYTECFDLSVTNKENNISLENAYPISNDKGKRLTPFTFTVTNTCDITTEYSVNLEVLNTSTLSSKFIDVMFEGNINLLSSYDSADKVNTSSIESRKLTTGILKSQESKDYSLRLWIDYNTTLEDLDNEIKSFKSKIVVVGKPINYTGDTVFNFDYTGSEQTFVAPVSGTYRLETWGAQGGNANENYLGGYGGHAAGEAFLAKDTALYINVGSEGSTCATTASCLGGYNGGGNAKAHTDDYSRAAGGGGSTHIALKSGLLSILENYKSDILIVSGGGGGGNYTNFYNGGIGGHAGGYIGSAATNYLSDNQSILGRISTGGTQKNAGCNSISKDCGSFGKGGDSSMTEYHDAAGSGGGAGYYGGSAANIGPGSGGSSYIGNSNLIKKVMYCYNCEESSEENTKTISTTCSEETPTSYCVKKGNGYARITLISIDE